MFLIALNIVATIIVYSAESIQNKPELHQDLNVLSPGYIPLFFGIAVFNFEGNGLVLNLHSSMKYPDKFEKVLRRSLIAYIALLVGFASFAYYVSNLIHINSDM